MASCRVFLTGHWLLLLLLPLLLSRSCRGSCGRRGEPEFKFSCMSGSRRDGPTTGPALSVAREFLRRSHSAVLLHTADLLHRVEKMY